MIKGPFHQDSPGIKGTSISDYPLWTVGYSGRNKPFKEADGSQDAQVNQKLMSEWKLQGEETPTLFDYHIWRYKEDLRRAKAKDAKWEPILSQIAKDTQNSCLPAFEEMFHSDQRALAVGTYVTMTVPKENRMQAFTLKTRKMLHEISGFHQTSGGMVCHFKNGQISDPKVIGLYKKLYLDSIFSG